MGLRSEWLAISSRIHGLDAASSQYYELTIKKQDSYSALGSLLLPEAIKIVQTIKSFHESYEQDLPQNVDTCLKAFLHKTQQHISSPQSGMDPDRFLFLSVALITLESELTHLLSDVQITIKRLSERAFLHLNRSIVADESIKQKWNKPFKQGCREEVFEKLGGAHLLSHGIWAFKASAEGERTDLVLQEPIQDLQEIRASSEGLVLTEWKIIRNKSELLGKIRDAKKQAIRYSTGVLGGLELSRYRYLVMVSEKRLPMPKDLEELRINYRIINIAVDPETPSKSKA